MNLLSLESLTESDWDALETYLRIGFKDWFIVYGGPIFKSLRDRYLKGMPLKGPHFVDSFDIIWNLIFSWELSELPLHINDFNTYPVNKAVLMYRLEAQ